MMILSYYLKVFVIIFHILEYILITYYWTEIKGSRLKPDIHAEVSTKKPEEQEEEEEEEENEEGEDDNEAEEVIGEQDEKPAEDSESIQVNVPGKDASVAEAKPVGLAIAGVGGVASSKPVATAIVGPGGLAVARPVATAIAGVSPSDVAGLGVPIAAHKIKASVLAKVIPLKRKYGLADETVDGFSLLVGPEYKSRFAGENIVADIKEDNKKVKEESIKEENSKDSTEIFAEPENPNFNEAIAPESILNSQYNINPFGNSQQPFQNRFNWTPEQLASGYQSIPFDQFAAIQDRSVNNGQQYSPEAYGYGYPQNYNPYPYPYYFY